MDGLLRDGKIDPGVVVEPGAEIYIVCDSNVRTDNDFAQVVKDTVISDPDVVPHRQLPRISNSNRRPELDRFAKFCSKESQEEVAPEVQGLGRPAKQGALKNPPGLDRYKRTTAELGRHPKPAQVLITLHLTHAD